MPQYEFLCNSCSKSFSKNLTLAEYEEGKVQRPERGSVDVEQRWSAIHLGTSKRAADP